jgi:hypothetical protein
MKNSTAILSLSIIMSITASLPAMAADNSGAWTKEEVEKMCYGKANGSTSAFERCLSHNDRKVGNKKKPGEAAALDNIDETFKQKAAERAPKKSTNTYNGNTSEQNKPKIF